MNMTRLAWSLVLFSAVAFVGCKEKVPPPPPQIVTMQSLQQAFSTASPELQSSANKVASGVRYGQYGNALAELDKLVNEPSLTPEQKTAASAMLDQVKAIMATNQPPTQ